jgi:hypothetical protein
MPGTTLQVTQQHRLKTRALPHDDDIAVGCLALRFVGALRIAFGLVEIEEHETLCWRGASPPQMCDPAHRHFDTRQRIAGAWSQLLHDEVDR